MYSFFVTYALLDEWKPGESDAQVDEGQNDLDRWLLSELNTLTRDVTDLLELMMSLAPRVRSRTSSIRFPNGIYDAPGGASGRVNRIAIRKPPMQPSTRR